MPTNNPYVTVRFEESETVTNFGTTKTTYRVRLDRVWTNVSQAAAATTRAISPCAGVVWMRIVEARLQIGTEIERCVEAPMQARRANTFDALLGRSSALKRTCRRERLTVQAGGRLCRVNARL